MSPAEQEALRESFLSTQAPGRLRDAHNALARELGVPEVLKHHREGNTQVRHRGARWNVPTRDTSVVPESDTLGEHIQSLAARHAAGFRFRPTADQREKLSRLHAEGRSDIARWVRARWRAQAQGRYVDSMVKQDLSETHPHLRLNARGVDITNPETGVSYELLRGSAANIHRHAMRMPHTLFRYVEF